MNHPLPTDGAINMSDSTPLTQAAADITRSQIETMGEPVESVSGALWPKTWIIKRVPSWRSRCGL